jgi:hypothetical protein
MAEPAVKTITAKTKSSIARWLIIYDLFIRGEMFWITSAASRIRGVHGATSSASDDGDGDDVGADLR